MNEEISSELELLITKHWGTFKKKLTPDNSIEEDLRITGDDVYDFLLDYSKTFAVDLSNFIFTDYFNTEGWALFSKYKKLKEFTLGDLEKGIAAGRLDQNVLSNNQ